MAIHDAGDAPPAEPLSPVERLARAVRARHARTARVDDWDCTSEDFAPATPDDGDTDLVYCEACGLIVWRDGRVAR